jgi:hypothetical protein
MMDNFTIDSTVWLADRVPDFHALPDNEKKAIGDFCLLWGLFEGRCLEASASIGRIVQFVHGIALALEQNGEFLDEPLAYFKDRYVQTADGFTYRFEKLRFRSRDKQEDVEAVLLGYQIDKPAVLIAMLIIVYRFRNNLFHGQKWEYELGDQLHNFSVANGLLMKAMDLSSFVLE